MGLVLKNSNLNITIDSNKIIGVMGDNYDSFLKSMKGNNISYIGKIDDFYTNLVIKEINIYQKDDVIINYYLKKMELDIGFLNSKISNLSNGERSLLRYLIGFIQNKKIIVIDDGFIDLDYSWKKKIISILRELINDNKTIIFGSCSSDLIYGLASKVLLINSNDYYYGDCIDVFSNLDILSQYRIKIHVYMLDYHISYDYILYFF